MTTSSAGGGQFRVLHVIHSGALGGGPEMVRTLVPADDGDGNSHCPAGGQCGATALSSSEGRIVSILTTETGLGIPLKRGGIPYEEW